MEEKRAGQAPDQAIAKSDSDTAQRTAPPTQGAPSGDEDAAALARGDERARRDRAQLNAKGFGDRA